MATRLKVKPEYFWRMMFEVVRKQMNQLADQYDLTSPIMIRKSVQLDKIHNQILKFNDMKKPTAETVGMSES